MEGFELQETPQQTSGAMVNIESERAIQEVQASLYIAKRFPRDTNVSYTRIMKSCERMSLAKSAEYAYPRGGNTVTGPTIRLAEVIAQNWGNLNFGIKELSQANGESEVEAFCWDLETNTKQSKTFKVPHIRYSKSKGNVKLTDPRDIYEMAANQGARRLRACILNSVPADIVEAAQKKCKQTLQKGIAEKPLEDQIRATLFQFDKIGVTAEMIEKRLGHNTSTITADELIELNSIGTSIKDGMTTREDWFVFGVKSSVNADDDLTGKILDDDENTFQCPQCDFKAASERGLKKHITQSHSESTEGEDDQPHLAHFIGHIHNAPIEEKDVMYLLTKHHGIEGDDLDSMLGSVEKDKRNEFISFVNSFVDSQ